MMKTIRNILHSGQVQRFHNHVGIDKQTLAEHQWNATMILMWAYPRCRRELILAVLTHDAPEYYTGDIPFPIKQDVPELKKVMESHEIAWRQEHMIDFDLTARELEVIKLVDVLEGLWFCYTQVKQGKLNAHRPYRKWKEIWLKISEPNWIKSYPEFNVFYDMIEEKMNECKR